MLGNFLTPPNQKGPPWLWNVWQILQKLYLIAQNKDPNALNATPKTPALYIVCFFVFFKSRKIVKNGIFQGFSWFFQTTITWKELEFLRLIQCIKTILLSYQIQLLDDFSYFLS